MALPPAYYEDGLVALYLGDSRDLLADVAADVLVTDPPYGVRFSGKQTKHTRRKSGGYTTPDSAEVGPFVVAAALAKVKRAGVFPGTRNMFAYPVPDDVGCVYCPAGAGIGRWGFTCFHPVLFYGPRPTNALTGPSSIQSFDTSDSTAHPCAKPLSWVRWLVGRVSLPGEVVFDPFAGTGSTLRAAKDLGRRAVGVELEERYCELAAERLRQGVLQLAEPEPEAEVRLAS